MVTDRQMRRLMSLLQMEQSLQVSADKAGMDCKTARKYRRLGQLPSASRKDHDWQPSPYFRRVGFRDHLFEASMTFMGITACTLGKSL